MNYESYKLFDKSVFTLENIIESFTLAFVFAGMFFLLAFLLYLGDRNKK